jgi:hypothetical protein
MKHRTALGLSLVLLGLSLAGQLSVALLPFGDPTRVAVQLVATLLIVVAGIILYGILRAKH